MLKARRVAEQRKLVWLAMWDARRVPLPAIVTLVRLGPQALDDDNLRGAFKAIRDGLADRLGVKDNDPRITWRYGQENHRKLDHGVVISVEPGALHPVQSA